MNHSISAHSIFDVTTYLFQIPIVSRSECKNVYKDYYISDNMFCAGYQSGRIDTCAGDSGKSLFLNWYLSDSVDLL